MVTDFYKSDRIGKMKSKRSYVNYGNLAFAALIIGIAFGLLGGYGVVKSLSAQRWETVEGKIVESRASRGSRSRSEPQIVYEYQVAGRLYKSEKIAFLFVTSSESDVFETVSKYPPDAKVTVYYNPADPAQAVLEPDVSIFSVLILIAGISLLAAWRWIKRKAKPKG